MRASWLTLMLLLASACWLSALLPLLPLADFSVVATSLILSVLSLALIVTVLVRIARFRAQLLRLLRRLLAGDYESGISVSARPVDEVTVLERLLDRLTGQLREYDGLRTERVRDIQRALDVLLENVTQPAMLLDTRRELLQCNPPWRDAFGIAQQSISFAAVERIPTNASFIELVRGVVDDDKSPKRATVRLQIPPQESHRDVTLQIVPVKPGNGDIHYAFILACPPADSPTASGNTLPTTNASA